MRDSIRGDILRRAGPEEGGGREDAGDGEEEREAQEHAAGAEA